MGSIRSALSLNSLRGNKTKDGSAIGDDNEHLPSGGATAGSGIVLSSRSQGGFVRLPDPNGSSKENQEVATEFYERKAMQKQMPSRSIVVQEEIDLKVVQADDQV